MTARPKLCRACDDTQTVSTGSHIFYICKKTGHYRNAADTCEIPFEKTYGRSPKNEEELETFTEYYRLVKKGR